MARIVKKHPLAVRWFHWINFPVLTIMIWSGLLIYWANDVYRLGWGDKTLIKFFPDSFYQALSVPFHLSTGMAFHFFFMWFFAINGLLYVLYTLFSGEWRLLVPNRRSLKEAWQVLLHDLHIRKTAPPQLKYNAAQRIAYTAIVVMGFGSLVTGLAIYKPVQLGWLCTLCGGYEAARIEHFALTIGYVLFFVVHIVQVVLAGGNNFQAIVTGFETAGPQIIRRTVIPFSVFFVLLFAGFMGWRWLYNQPQDDAVQAPLRENLKVNEAIFRGVFSPRHLATSFSLADAVKNVRVNGDAGMGNNFDAGTWKLKVARKAGDTLVLTLNDIKALPKTDIIFDFKCVEGWSQVTHWGGVRFSDFVKKYGLDDQAGKNYVGMVTPDKEYYVGNDMPSMMQPQTLLCYEMNGKPLPMNQGYPLRLIIPVKYGIKHIKRIGTIFFSNDRPADYWAERGYDYYAGL